MNNSASPIWIIYYDVTQYGLVTQSKYNSDHNKKVDDFESSGLRQSHLFIQIPQVTLVSQLLTRYRYIK